MRQRDLPDSNLHSDLGSIPFRVPDHSRVFRSALVIAIPDADPDEPTPALEASERPPEVPFTHEGMATFIIGGDSATSVIGASSPSHNHIKQDENMNSTGQAGTWVPLGTVKHISGITVSRGGYYLADRKGDQVGSTLLGHVINLALPAYASEPAPYSYLVADYRRMEPESRHAYLQWLARDHQANIDPFGPQSFFWRMYISGIEYRILVESKLRDEVCDGEFLALFNELKRLSKMNSYEAHRVYHLIQWMKLMRPKVFALKMSDVLDYHMSDLIRLALSQASHEGKLMPVKSLMAWTLLKMPNISNSSSQMRLIYSHVFRHAYAKLFPTGLKLKSSRRQLVLNYHPISFSTGKQELSIKGLTDVLSPPSNLDKIEVLVKAVRQSTSAYRQYVSDKPGNADSLCAYTLLPDEVIEHVPPPSAESFKQWASDVFYARQGYVKASEVIHAIEPEQVGTGSLGKNKVAMIHKAVTLVGYAVAPDPAYHSVALEYDSRIQLIELSQPGRVSIDQHFHEVVMACRFAAVVNSLADQPDPALYDVLTQMLETMNKLSNDQRQVLSGYVFWLGKSDVDSKRLYSYLDEMGDDYDRLFVAKTMVTALATLGSLSKKQLKKIEFFYKKLELEPDLAFTMMHDSRAGDASVPVASTSAPAPFSLNRDTLQRHEQETYQVQALLGDIFNEPEDMPVPASTPKPLQGAAQLALEENDCTVDASIGHCDVINDPVTAHVGARYPGLDTPHAALFQHLSSRSQWSMDEVTRLCRDRSLMTEGALEIINDWAFENADDAVFDVADKLYVHADIAAQLYQLQQD